MLGFLLETKGKFMEPTFQNEAHRAKRYVIVRVVSRGCDIIIFLFLVWWWGVEWMPLAFFISAFFDYCFDFFGQKLWSFKNSDKTWKELMREFCIYVPARLGNVLLAGGLIYLLYVKGKFPLWFTLLIVIPIFWTIVFGIYRWLFTGSIKDLLQAIRVWWKRRYQN